jgi:hypothetical protein
MTTQRKVDANQRNAKKSTGPRTVAGKQRVSMNALSHGLQAKVCRMVWESEEEFNEYQSAMLVELAPVGALECIIADSIIAAQWRLQRLCSIEKGSMYRAIANAVEIRAMAAPNANEAVGLPISSQYAMTTVELYKQHESVIAAGFAYDLSEGQTLVHIDRFRRSYERTISENLNKLDAMQQARFEQEAEDEIEVYEDDMITDEGTEQNDNG